MTRKLRGGVATPSPMRWALAGALAVLTAAQPTVTGAQIHLWSRASTATAGWGNPAEVFEYGQAVDKDGNVYITGSFDGTIDMGLGPHPSVGGWDVFLAKFDPAGNPIWDKTFGGPGNEGSSGVGVDGNGNVYIGGYFREFYGGDGIDFGGGVLLPVSVDKENIFVAKFDSGGAHQWSHGYGGIANNHVQSVAVNTSGTLAIAGQAIDVDFGFGGTGVGWGMPFVVTFDTDGSPLWQGGASTPDKASSAGGVDINDAGEVALIGTFTGRAYVGPNVYTSHGYDPPYSDGYSDYFVVKYAADGSYLWSRAAGYWDVDTGNAVSLNGAGDVAVVGRFNGQINLSDPVAVNWLMGIGTNDIFVATYTFDGTLLWAKALGNTATLYQNRGYAIDLAYDRSVVVTGSFRDTLDFGGGGLTSAGGEDAFAASYDETGAHMWSERFGGSVHSEFCNNVDRRAPGEVWLSGWFVDGIDLGGGPLIGPGNRSSAFVARFGVPGNSPAITSVQDVPDDQGGFLRVEFMRSVHDQPFGIDRYEVWRVDLRSGPSLMAKVPPVGQDLYTVDVKSHGDGIPTTYFVRAIIPRPGVFYDSNTETGVSYDNLAPGPVQGFQTFYYPTGVQMRWMPSTELDLAFYRVYRDNSGPFFVPTPENLLIELTDTEYADLYSMPYDWHYKVSAVDHAGNEGAATNPSLVVDAPSDPPRPEFVLEEATPNPFNPRTEIRYSLSADGPASLRIYDIAGRAVATLVDGVQSAGPHREVWTGIDERGRLVASGVYIYELRQGSRHSSKRVVLLR